MVAQTVMVVVVESMLIDHLCSVIWSAAGVVCPA
jgi:hypothetical protein